MSTPEIIFATNVVLSFPHLIEAHKSKIAAPTAVAKYSADFIMAQDHPAFRQFMQRYAEMAQQKWAEHAPQVMQMIQAERKLRCYGVGTEKVDKKTFKPCAGYDGNVFISASRENAPQMIQADGSPVDPANTMAYQALARKMYGGCKVNVALRPWVQENTFGRGIRCDLVAIQFAADGTPFGDSAEPDVTNMFGAVVGATTNPFAPAQPAASAFTMPGLPSFM